MSSRSGARSPQGATGGGETTREVPMPAGDASGEGVGAVRTPPGAATAQLDAIMEVDEQQTSSAGSLGDAAPLHGGAGGSRGYHRAWPGSWWCATGCGKLTAGRQDGGRRGANELP